MAKIKFLGEEEPNPIREVTVVFLNEKCNYAVVTAMEISDNTELKPFSGMYKTQLAGTVWFLILNHWLSEAAKKTWLTYSLAKQAILKVSWPSLRLSSTTTWGQHRAPCPGSSGVSGWWERLEGSPVKEVPS